MKKFSAFTFIEIMIAIVIFSVGILAVLNLLTNNLRSMDKNDLMMQATFLAKEGMELVYNLRDSNLEKELSWNCLINPEMYTWNSDDLANNIGRGNYSDFEDVICKGYFGLDNKVLQISFDPNDYMYLKISEATNNFISNYEANKLTLFNDENGFVWYGYQSNGSGTQSNFARYISFKQIKEGNNILPQNQIIKIESHVLYMRGSTTGEVVFESFIGNY